MVFCPEKIPAGEMNGDELDSDESESESDEEVEDETLGGFIVPDEDGDAFESKHHKSSKGKANKRAEPKKTLAELKKESLRNKSAKRKYLRRLKRNFQSSAKINRTIELIDSIQAKDPSEKILVFSQFTALLDLLEVPLNEKRMKYQRYDGSMKPNDRVDAVSEFMENEATKVMLVSLKAGNAGLNLTRASQVIMLDPFWNPFVEEQAVDRAHRMMQEREVHVHRVLVPETVEDRICTLQDQKKEIIGQALDEREGKEVGKLSVQNLMYLFGC
jgi:SNF2 family DNA or RNA helicase